MSKTPTAREFQWDKPFCILERDDCVDCFEPIDENGRKNVCSNCKLAVEKKNE